MKNNCVTENCLKPVFAVRDKINLNRRETVKSFSFTDSEDGRAITVALVLKPV